MSSIIGIKFNDGIFFSSDSSGINIIEGKIRNTNNSQKIYRILNQNLLLGFCGINFIGISVYNKMCAEFLHYNSIENLLKKIANYLLNLNIIFYNSPEGHYIRKLGFEPFTIIAIAGYFSGKQRLFYISEDGNISEVNKMLIMGESVKYISEHIHSIEKIDLFKNFIKNKKLYFSIFDIKNVPSWQKYFITLNNINKI